MEKERNKVKHPITQEELMFLQNLQHTMNTQDTVCQADPRFWVIVQETKTYTSQDYGEECDLVCDGDTLLTRCTIDSLIEYFLDEENDFTEELEAKGIYFISPEENKTNYWLIGKMFDKDAGPNVDYDNTADIYDINDVIEFLNDENIINSDYQIVWYNIDDTSIVSNTMFLTLEEAEEHIKYNHYHYTNPRPYAMTAWRSPQVEVLYKILQTVDWTNGVNTNES